MFQSHLNKMRMFNVEVLKNLQGECTVFLAGRYSLQDLSKGVNDIRYDELILFIDNIPILVIFFAENPSVHSLSNRNLLFFEESQQCLH